MAKVWHSCPTQGINIDLGPTQGIYIDLGPTKGIYIDLGPTCKCFALFWELMQLNNQFNNNS